MIDPASEINSTITAIRGGLTTLSEAIRQNGYDPAEVLAERAQDDKELDRLGLVLDTDPRIVNKSGMTQQDVVQQKSVEMSAQGQATSEPTGGATK